MNNRKPPNRNIVSFYLNNSEYASLKLVAALEQKSIHGYVKDLVYTRIPKVKITKENKQELAPLVDSQLEALQNYILAMYDIQELATKILSETERDENEI